MAPSAISVEQQEDGNGVGLADRIKSKLGLDSTKEHDRSAHTPVQAPESTQGQNAAATQHRQPLKPTGALDAHEWFDVTPVIGREFEKTNIVDDILNAPNANDLLNDLALTVSQRGVVFFRAQNNLTNELQKQLVDRLGKVSGKPADSTLHIHPVLNDSREFGVGDNEVSTISSEQRKQFYKEGGAPNRRKYDAAQWHSDIQFERVPADYTSLRLTKLPKTGGDTLWASGYEIYDRFSPAYRRFLEGLTAHFSGDGFNKMADSGKFQLYGEARGSPANRGSDLWTDHPVVRTNPVSGWKSVFAVGTFPRRINELNEDESDELLKKFKDIIYQNHDLQVRLKWKNENDIAIWDNRSAFHTATFDYEGLGERFGNRTVGIGEKPYLDPNSKSRSEDLANAVRPVDDHVTPKSIAVGAI